MWLLYLFLSLVVILSALILFAIAPRPKRDAFPFDRTRFAHRGLFDNEQQIPENSLAAFQAAKDAGYGVEFDVRFTADRQIVVFHDDTLERMCGDNRRVDECSYEQLQELRLLDTNEQIPLLSDVLNLLDNTTVLCEIKNVSDYFDTSLCKATYAILCQYKGAYCIESFNPTAVRWFQRNAPKTIRGILSKRYNSDDVMPAFLRPLLSSLLINFYCRPDFIAYQATDQKQPFFRLCGLFRPLRIAWTIHNPQEEKQTKECFDTFIFEGYRPVNTP